MDTPGSSCRLDGPVRFAGLVFDPRTGELSSTEEVVRLGEKPAAALEALLANAGTVVDRPKLCQHLWPDGTVVDYDNNLNAAIKKLRDTLEAHADTSKLIETLPRRGYRFVGALSAKPGATAPQPSQPSQEPGPPWPGLLRTSAFAIPMLLLLAFLGIASMRLRSDAAGFATPTPTSPARERRARLAVLPFADLGASDAEADSPPAWLRDGLAEELITLIGRLEPSRLGVIARHSSMQFRDRAVSMAEVSEQLAVGWVIEGTVAAIGTRVRVTVRLVRTDDETVVWADRFEESRAETETLVRRVAAGVGRALADRLVAGDAAARLRGATLSGEAYEAFLIGRAAWHRFDADGYREARESFERALVADPDFAPAHAALADTHNLLAFTDTLPRADAFAAAERAAREALARDPNLALGHNALAFARLYGSWDVGGALSHFARAIELDPNFAMAHHWRAGALAAAGRTAEAVEAARTALSLDPLSLSVISDLGWYLIYDGRFEEAAAQCLRTLEASPRYNWAAYCQIEASRQLGDLATAISVLRDQRQPGPEIRAAHPDLDAPDPAVALAAFDRLTLQQQRARPQPNPLDLAESFARIGDRDAAFESLERAFASRDPWILFVPVQPFFDSLHGDPRMLDLAKRIGLPTEAIRALE